MHEYMDGTCKSKLVAKTLCLCIGSIGPPGKMSEIRHQQENCPARSALSSMLLHIVLSVLDSTATRVPSFVNLYQNGITDDWLMHKVSGEIGTATSIMDAIPGGFPSQSQIHLFVQAQNAYRAAGPPRRND